MTKTSLHTFINYYGGKWRAAPMYPKPEHRTIVEPFAGGAGYSLRYADHDVVLYEKDRDLVSMWKWLIQATPADVQALPVLPEFSHVDEIDAPHGAKVMIGFGLNAGAAESCKSPSKWVRYKPNGVESWSTRRRERVAKQVDFVSHWECHHVDDYSDIPDQDATWFIDPPYQVAGRRYRHGSDGIDFPALAEWCRIRSGQVIVCENEGADWMEWTDAKSVRGTQGTRRSGKSSEVWFHRSSSPHHGDEA